MLLPAYFFLLEELLFFDELLLELELEDELLLLEAAGLLAGGIEFGSSGCTVTCIEAYVIPGRALSARAWRDRLWSASLRTR